ncbi:hypothetical protein [Micromonospora sp. NBC_01796]|uniref:hypothetical protein n=1 Tax=Micromonospora sp. NBC_01796 TaxID=2975987 RepID=UPI002DD946D6|nr:hypothetical protein [Micromonospora sp. NBC_01796]WSA86523.1 hypothetical protein OIE47_02545 [Micromonospora sp. NBC_01796]
MATDRVTITLDALTREAAQRSAEAAGVSFSAYVNRAVRRQTLADSMRAEAAYLAAHPAVRAELVRHAEQDEVERGVAYAAELDRVSRTRAS